MSDKEGIDDNPDEEDMMMIKMATLHNLPTSFGKREEENHYNRNVKNKKKQQQHENKENDSFYRKMLQDTMRPIDQSKTCILDKYPVSHEFKLENHSSKTISIIEIENNGSRMITASHDYSMTFWEWASMDNRLLPFRSTQPIENNKLSAIKFSPDGRLVIVCSSSLRPKLFDRHGAEIKEFQNGDPYLRDLKKTGGHTSAITCAGWKQADRFWTAGMDGTIRTWNPDQHLKCTDISVLKGPTGMSRCSITSAKLSRDGKTFAVASTDGHLRIISAVDGIRDSQALVDFANAHVVGTETSALELHPSNDYIFATRGSDDTVKVWDIRNNKSGPIFAKSGLENTFGEAGLAWSPHHDHVILTGTCVKNKSTEKAKLIFIDTLNTSSSSSSSSSSNTLSNDSNDKDKNTNDNDNDNYTIEMSNYSLAAINWSPVLNQIFVGQANGTISIFYDPEKSKKGILIPISKQATPKVQAIYENEIGGPIMIPFAQDAKTALRVETDYGFGYNSEIPYSDIQLAMKRTTSAGYCADRHDPIKSHKPEMGLEGPGRGGKLGSTITQSIMKSVLAERNKRIREEDPREAILRYAKVAEEDPYFVSPAYKTTQPFPVLDEGLLKEEKEKIKKKIESEEIKRKLSKK